MIECALKRFGGAVNIVVIEVIEGGDVENGLESVSFSADKKDLLGCNQCEEPHVIKSTRDWSSRKL